MLSEKIGNWCCASLQISYGGSDDDKLKFPVAILQDKTKRTGVFHILKDKQTLVAGFKARFRNVLACLLE